MATGRRDYTAGVYAQTSVYGYSPEPIDKMSGKYVLAGTLETVLEYTVPVGYRLTILSLVFSSRDPGTLKFSFGKVGGDQMIVYFDTIFTTYCDKGVQETYKENEVVVISCVNDQAFPVLVYAHWFGILEYVG